MAGSYWGFPAFHHLLEPDKTTQQLAFSRSLPSGFCRRTATRRGRWKPDRTHRRRTTVIAFHSPRRDEATWSDESAAEILRPIVPPCKVALERVSNAFSSVCRVDRRRLRSIVYVMDAACAPELVDCALEPNDYFVCALAVLFEAVLFGFVARTVTRPQTTCGRCKGSCRPETSTYSITPRGSTELVELSTSFAQMRGQLLALQQQRIDTNELRHWPALQVPFSHICGIICRDCRHAEFLYEADD